MLLGISILPQTSEELFYFVTKRIPYLCGFWRFANAYEWMTERRATLGKLKLFENILKAASALIASAMSIIKFIGIIGKMKPAAL